MTTWQIVVVVFAAVALGLSAFAVWVAWNARSRSLEAKSSIGRHVQEHRFGIEDEGLRRHRLDEPPLTGHMPRVEQRRPRTGDDEEPGLDTQEHPAPRPLPGLPPPGSIPGRRQE